MKSLFVIFAATLLSLLIVACSNSASNATSPTDEARRPKLASEACQAKGGRWIRGGVLMFYGCLHNAPDAGKFCTDSQQCKYDCNAGPENESRVGLEAIGRCQRSNSYTGCKNEIKNGVVQPPFCVKI